LGKRKSRKLILNNVPKRKRGDKETLVMDPIHGFIDISEYPVIKELIETPYFQRLRRLNQLGLTSSVYPNATHSRFAHSLGVMHVFLILFDSITRRSTMSKKRIEQLRPIGAVSALLHDIGHGPFSHASEKILDDGKFDHEAMTRNMILKTKIAEILKKNKIDPQLICNILKHEVSGELRMVSQLVSSQLDADRLDYLIRDSFFTGVNYGKIDIQRIANTLKIWNKDKSSPFKGTVVVSQKGKSAIEDYILGRYLMYRGVYFHKVSRCMERMLGLVFKRAAQTKEGLDALKKIVDVKKKITPSEMLRLDDNVWYSLFYYWTHANDSILKDFSNRIINRKLLSTIQLSVDDFVQKTITQPQALKTVLNGTKYDPEYYFIEDAVEKSAYDMYSTDKIDDKYSPISHIMIENNDELHEISSESVTVRSLSTDNKAKIISLFFPQDVLPKVNAIVHN